MIVALPATRVAPFAASHDQFESILRLMDSDETAGLSHGELEELLDSEGRELLRRLLQDHLDLRSSREQRVEVVAADGVRHGSVEPGHTRPLTSVFGKVNVTRMAYRRRGGRTFTPPTRR